MLRMLGSSLPPHEVRWEECPPNTQKPQIPTLLPWAAGSKALKGPLRRSVRKARRRTALPSRPGVSKDRRFKTPRERRDDPPDGALIVRLF